MCGDSQFRRRLSSLSTAQRRSTLLQERINEPDILIIGAGAAGIACATKLLQMGFKNVTVLEAEKRIGGRIHTIPFADNNVDLGAQWVHGKNTVYKLVKDRGLLSSSGNLFVDYECRRSNGIQVSPKIIHLLKNTISEILEKRHKASENFSGSLADFLNSKFTTALEDPKLQSIEKEIALEFFENFKKIESSETGAPLEDISARCFNDFWECEGEYLLNWKKKGFCELFRVLTKADKHHNQLGILENKILTNMKVEQVAWQQFDDGKVRVKCKNVDKVFVADHVVVTVSLGVLKENFKSMFAPQLPIEKINVINNLAYGAVGKVFLEFEHKFWPSKWTGLSLLWRDRELTELRRSPNAWLEDIFGFYTVPYQPRVLHAWIVSKRMAYIETLSKKDVQDGCMSLLKKFLPNWEIPNPVRLETTGWSTNPNFRGAFSYRSLQTDNSRVNVIQLAAPITVLAGNAVAATTESLESLQALLVKPVVLFAGEATSLHYYTTVHGAVESGWREAVRLGVYYDKG